MSMDGRAIFNFMMRKAPAAVDACLEKNNLTRDDIDFFVFHQASRFMVESLARSMRLPPEKTPLNVANFGNTVSSSIPLVLEDLRDNGQMTGKKVLVCGFGVGLSWAANVLYFNNG